MEAVKSGHKDLRGVLKTVDQSKTVVAVGPRIVKDTTRSNKIVDTEETRASSSVRPDGRIVTETERTTEHEEVKDDELPEDAPEQDVHLENSQRSVEIYLYLNREINRFASLQILQVQRSRGGRIRS